jgi:hypothetical protein
MPYSLHFVPKKRTTEVLLSLLQAGDVGEPMNQRTWPNWVRMLQDVGPYLPEEERQRTKANLAAGRTHWLPEIWLSDLEIERMGL